MQATDQDQQLANTPMFAGGGEMGALMRSINWSQTPLGSIERWPQSLRTSVSVCLHSRFPILLWWGSELVMLYNDAYRPMLGATKHPQAMGRAGREVWPEIWEIIGPMLEGVLARGEATWSDDQLLLLDRNGYVEECYFTFSYSPIHDEAGKVGGIFCAVTETTERVLGERRLKTLRDLGEPSLVEAKTAQHACRAAAATLAENPHDFPFALIYLLLADGRTAYLAEAVNLAAGTNASPPGVGMDGPDDPWNFRQVVATNQSQVVEDLEAQFGQMVAAPWAGESIKQALVLPLAKAGVQDAPAGFLITGISPRLALADAYRSFLELAAQQLATAIANAQVYEEERKRAEALIELDRAKTTFFSNISHEFRTPLTLMLGPLEDIRQQGVGALTADQREQIDITHRNALRLLKLVNTLLDFSRIEAGRMVATYEPTNLAAFTAELASAFRSASERAGLKLIVDCPPLSEPAYVDHDMWEKIVFNLLSNAFKFTFAGQITVALRPRDAQIELSVSDTGTGIAAADLPRLFERFHRVAGARGRTFEGTGIGLALVQELARSHGGAVRVESEVGRGSTFTVTIPRGSAHLPADRIGAARAPASAALHGEAYVEEALRWLPDEDRTEIKEPRTELASRPNTQNPELSPQSSARILLADDNADMRDYVGRLLSPYYLVQAVPNGAAALAAAREQLPDLVLADVMMPELDGVELLQALRADERTREVPVILLSARAGEEARIEGLAAGADDYLVKPFSARELLARVEARLELARLRRAAIVREQALRAEAERVRTQLAVILNSISDAFVAIDHEWRYTYVNDQAAALLGQRDSLIGRRVREGFLNTVGSAAYTQLQQALAERRATSFETLHPGSGHRYEGRAYPSDEGLSIFFTDITERTRAEEALREREARYRQLANAMPQLVWTSDSNGVVDYYNSRAAEYAGIMRTADGIWDWQPVLHPDDLEPTLSAWQEAVQRGQIYAIEHRVQMQNGSFRWHLSRAIPARDRDGRIVKWFGTATDIHKQHQSTQDARCLADIGEIIRLTADAQGMLDQVTHILGEYLQVRRCMVIEIDLAHNLGLIRQQYCRGAPPVASEYRLTEYSEVAQIEIDTGRTIVNADSQIDPRTAAIYEATYRPHGERAYIAIPLMRDGKRNGTLWVSDDLPRQWEAREVQLLETVAERVWLAIEKLRVEQALRANEERLQMLYVQEQAARAQAEAASRLKDEFLATVSHELRTPLTSILGYGQIIQTRKHDEAYVGRTIEKIVRSAKAQAQLIDDLLDVARIVTGKLRLEPQPIDMDAVIRTAIETLQPAIAAKELRLDIGLNTPAITIVGDPNRLQQVVWNLVSNAVKFTPSGGSIRVRLERQAGQAQLTVGDTGQGISAEFLPYVFDRFRQAESTSTRAHGGLGLGLAIVRHLIEMHGGTVQVESPGEGQGATFTVRLPIVAGDDAAQRAAAEDAEPCPPALAGMRVLIVDDQPDIVELLHDLLAPCGVVVRMATAAQEALAILRAWQPDVLVSDIAMPGEDGYWLIRNLRALSLEEGGGIPALALTAYVRMEERLQVLAAGFQLYVPKPVDPAELLDAVARLARAQATDEP